MIFAWYCMDQTYCYLHHYSLCKGSILEEFSEKVKEYMRENMSTSVPKKKKEKRQRKRKKQTSLLVQRTRLKKVQCLINMIEEGAQPTKKQFLKRQRTSPHCFSGGQPDLQPNQQSPLLQLHFQPDTLPSNVATCSTVTVPANVATYSTVTVPVNVATSYAATLSEEGIPTWLLLHMKLLSYPLINFLSRFTKLKKGGRTSKR